MLVPIAKSAYYVIGALHSPVSEPRRTIDNRSRINLLMDYSRMYARIFVPVKRDATRRNVIFSCLASDRIIPCNEDAMHPPLKSLPHMQDDYAEGERPRRIRRDDETYLCVRVCVRTTTSAAATTVWQHEGRLVRRKPAGTIAELAWLSG